MAGFEKPKPLKAALKVGLYGPAGSGKTFTSLLLAEGLARHAGKRVAFCDTEHGTAFYSQHVPERAAHPDAFDFDVLHTKSITEVLAAVQALDQDRFGVLVIDSITHLWDACRNAYNGKLTRAGTIPLHAWGAIKTIHADRTQSERCSCRDIESYHSLCGASGTGRVVPTTSRLDNRRIRMSDPISVPPRA
jgi:KaiC/GvpD/RAD55 family RecA-like ATPase